jgi:hypothetical protein
MHNFKIYIDLLNVQRCLSKYTLREYSLPFSIYFIEAANPDDACHEIMKRLMRIIIKQDNSIEGRIVCRKIRRDIRIDRVISV